MTAADKESGRGGTVGVVEDTALVVDEGAVRAFGDAEREAPLVVAIGAARVASWKRRCKSQEIAC